MPSEDSTEITLKLPDQMVAIIGQSLEMQPYKTVISVVNEIQRQITAQRITKDTKQVAKK